MTGDAQFFLRFDQLNRLAFDRRIVAASTLTGGDRHMSLGIEQMLLIRGVRGVAIGAFQNICAKIRVSSSKFILI